MNYLLVIDMQEDYLEVKNQKKPSYETSKLVTGINEKIAEYPQENVVYIMNQFFFEKKSTVKKPVKGLKVVSDKVFIKRKQDSFSNKELLKFLKDKKVSQLEIVGIDGNYCVLKTALGAANNGFQVTVDIDNVGIKNEKKFLSSKNVLKQKGIKIKSKQEEEQC